MTANITVMSVSFALFVAYFVLVLYIGLQIGFMIYYRHKLRSFRMGTLIQCFIWALLRTLYFLLYNSINRVRWIDRIVYWIPFNLQFSIFSFLVVYYRHMHHEQKSEWKTFKTRYIITWAILNVTFLLLQIVWISLGIAMDDPSRENEDPQWLASVHLYFNGAVFFILVIVLAWNGWKSALLMKMGSQSKLLARLSFVKILAITFTLFFLFTTRTIYNFISASSTKFAVQVDGGATQSALITLFAFLLWEIVPTILVLVLFGTVKSTSLGAFSRPPKSTTPHKNSKVPSVPPNQGKLLRDLFSDPRRYDSDEETSPLMKPAFPSSNSPISINSTSV